MIWKDPAAIMNRILNKSRNSVKDDIEKVWKSIQDIHMDSRILTFKEGELIVAVESSAKLQQLNFRKDEICRKLNSETGAAVKNIRFRLGGF